MRYRISAACHSVIGKIREGNEDNFYFNGGYLFPDNKGMQGAALLRNIVGEDSCFAVFDGMGGEAYGEVASYTAATTLKEKRKQFVRASCSPQLYLENVCEAMNLAVCGEMSKLRGRRMGTTAAVVYFDSEEVYVCNIGDSRIYRLRDNELMQLSEEHVEQVPAFAKGKYKGRLTQHFGIYPNELIIEPYIAKTDIRKGDIFLLCSDGVTDMLSDVEIGLGMKKQRNVRKCVEHIINLALDHGGRDNATAIMIQVH